MKNQEPVLRLSNGQTITLSECELAAWERMLPESRWEVMQFSATAAHIVLSAERDNERTETV